MDKRYERLHALRQPSASERHVNRARALGGAKAQRVEEITETTNLRRGADKKKLDVVVLQIARLEKRTASK